MHTLKTYRENVAVQLKAIAIRIEALRIGADKLRSEARQEFEELIETLHISRETVEENLMELGNSDDWEQLRGELDRALQDLQEAVIDAAAQLN